ncbi:N-acetylglutamate synthase, CG3035 family [Mycobacterium talmoniae]|uniref:GNAT family N-acetyltransferase n=1 Tax=Mycobacterium talmoniae TaxID=1858794 RepID=A0A1S1NK11_9MYCO|nr:MULTISPECIES: GNAT family N-acetyltransferase [Mycobacterium]OHV04175.1 GNAT family N-acetyltransferase [Mycobacterium talmoniae]TDH56197.1 GNAT family N-acetyltransferase [Mycobacterium eburneum]
MVQLPGVGTRVSLRYLRPAGSDPPMGDVIGYLVEVGPRVRVQTRDGDVHEFRRDDVLYVRRLTDRPVKNSQIRAVEQAAALAWPGVEHQWLDGWLLRAGHGSTLRANSAVPLDMFAHASSIPAIVDWYAQRDLTPWLAVPERLLRLPEDLPAACETRTLVGEPDVGAAGTDVTLSPAPTPDWLAGYRRDVPVAVLTAVADGEVVFGARAGVAVGRAAVTRAPDGQPWVGVSELRVAADQRRRGHARALCAALLRWGRDRGAARAYVQLRSEDDVAIQFFESLGFAGQHRSRYLDARLLAS